MNITRFHGDENTLAEIRKWFTLSLVPLPSNTVLTDLLARYRQLKSQGFTKTGIVVRWKKEGVNAMQAAAFVNAMQRIDGGIQIQDPAEKPEMREILADYKKDVDAGAQAIFGDFPYLKIALAVGGVILAYGFVTGAGRGVTSR